MNFFILVEKLYRRSCLGEDWRISINNPARLLDFNVKGMRLQDIQERVDKDFDCGSFPVKVKITTPDGDKYIASRSGIVSRGAVCTGQLSKIGERYLTFDLR